MNWLLKVEFMLCVVFPCVACPTLYFVAHASLIGSLYGFGLMPVFVLDWLQERRRKRIEAMLQ